MLLAAADPSSYNLFSGVIRSFCFIIEWRQTMPLGSCITNRLCSYLFLLVMQLPKGIVCLPKGIDSLSVYLRALTHFHSEPEATCRLTCIWFYGVSVDHRNYVKRILHNSLDN